VPTGICIPLYGSHLPVLYPSTCSPKTQADETQPLAVRLHTIDQALAFCPAVLAALAADFDLMRALAELGIKPPPSMHLPGMPGQPSVSGVIGAGRAGVEQDGVGWGVGLLGCPQVGGGQGWSRWDGPGGMVQVGWSRWDGRWAVDRVGWVRAMIAPHGCLPTPSQAHACCLLAAAAGGLAGLQAAVDDPGLVLGVQVRRPVVEACGSNLLALTAAGTITVGLHR